MQTPIDLIPFLLQVLGGILGMLTAILAWLGVRIHNRLDDIGRSLSSIERDLRGDLSDLDRRVTRVEEHCAVQHRRDGN